MKESSNLKAIVCPATKLHDAGLFVKWEILYIDFATGFVDGRRLPLDQPVVVDGGFGRQRHLEVSIRTIHTHIIHTSFGDDSTTTATRYNTRAAL